MSGNTFHPITARYQTISRNDALCVRMEGEDEDIWFPTGTWRCDEPIISYERGDEITLEVAEWLLVKSGLDWMV